eukprot:Blabericola_migrator_1__12951@NODE_857_length_6241_cov_107_054746_g607_i0_p7_GENE_NODE_857_length_6241_cov_107_054746_g607_i0NODE_857_length_6241_cov_107_054746_g607_i0_p7_ORF_typecomplete_len101_score3_34_NODE_857_length_6241_cov_107_054746_g607_i041954497
MMRSPVFFSTEAVHSVYKWSKHSSSRSALASTFLELSHVISDKRGKSVNFRDTVSGTGDIRPHSLHSLHDSFAWTLLMQQMPLQTDPDDQYDGTKKRFDL